MAREVAAVSSEQAEVLIGLQRKLIEEQRETNELLTRIIELGKHRHTVRCEARGCVAYASGKDGNHCREHSNGNR